jgi:hypothetical protein
MLVNNNVIVDDAYVNRIVSDRNVARSEIKTVSESMISRAAEVTTRCGSSPGQLSSGN